MNDKVQKLKDALSKDDEGSALLSREISIYILDCSGSMDGKLEPHATKMQALKEGIGAAMEARIETQSKDPSSTDEVAIVLCQYNHRESLVEVRLQQPRKVSEEHTRFVSGLFAHGGTPLWGSLERVKKIVERMPAAVIRVVIVGDGEPESKQECFDTVKDMYDRDGVIFDTIVVGNEEYAPSSCDSAFMQSLAEVGQGTFTKITSASGFKEKMLESEAERRTLLGKAILLLTR